MIACTDITKIYRTGVVETPVLRGVSFTVADGEFVAIMGPSGSGKSTLMHIMGCLDQPTSGTYLLDGRNVAGLSDDELALVRNRSIGFVFQSFHLLPRASVTRNVALPMIYAGVGGARRADAVASALRSAALPDAFWSHRPNQLSGGMMQRVAIARALVNRPSLILADEPTGNLDSATGEAVLGAFQRLHADEGRTVILITHEPYVAEHAERIIQLRDGRMVEDRRVTHRRRASHHTTA